MTDAANTKPELPANVRVRFCPSPTGTPHVGMIRTALFNWAEARATGGTLIFRIEDTDAVRDSEESYNQILESLRWLGIDWDEGIDVGGPHGPYRQSERTDIYKDVAAKLLEAGYAYESFSTPEEIKERNLAAGRPAEFGYDGYDRTLTDEQKEAFRAEGRKPALRLRMPDEDIAFDDLIRGTIEFKAGSVPDYVIVRPNGDPLYTLTNPVDDAMMEINVVLRGEDLLSSTPRQIVLYRYLMELGIAKEMPLFGHMPYVMGQGNKKLSKRDPESNLFNHRDNGFIREGLLNYLALLGWSIAPDRDVFSMDEMIAKFDVRDVKANPARFDIDKAISINAEHIRMLEPEDFLRRSVPYLHRDGVVSADNWDALTAREQEILTAAAPLVQRACVCWARSLVWSAPCCPPRNIWSLRMTPRSSSRIPPEKCWTPPSPRWKVWMRPIGRPIPCTSCSTRRWLRTADTSRAWPSARSVWPCPAAESPRRFSSPWRSSASR